MAERLCIMKRDGSFSARSGEKTSMAQAQALAYLQKLIHNNRFASLSQALNDVFSEKGKATGAYLFDAHPVLHASSGDGQQSVTLFFYKESDTTAVLFAMGEHLDLPKPKVRYKVSDYGQAQGDFKANATIILV
jgi:hypothetical protein